MRRHLRAFTLLELMVVLVVVAALTFVATSSWPAYWQRMRRAAAERLERDGAAHRAAPALDALVRHEAQPGVLGIRVAARQSLAPDKRNLGFGPRGVGVDGDDFHGAEIAAAA